MNIIIDAMGGDNAPLEILKGAADAVKEYGVQITAVGSADSIAKTAQANASCPTILPCRSRPSIGHR